MDEAAAEREVRHYLLRELIRDDEIDLERDEAIFSSGLLDSFSVTQLICFLEDRFDIKIAISEVTLPDFDTIGKILELLEPPLEQRLPRRAKQALIVVMAASIFVLLLALEQSGGTPFLYIGF